MDANQGSSGGDEPRDDLAPPAPEGLQVMDAGPADAEALRLATEASGRAAHERTLAANLLGGQVRIGLTRWFGIAVACSLLAARLQHPDAALLQEIFTRLNGALVMALTHMILMQATLMQHPACIKYVFSFKKIIPASVIHVLMYKYRFLRHPAILKHTLHGMQIVSI